MNLDYGTLYKNIFKRSSIRNFADIAISSDVNKYITALTNSINSEAKNMRLVFVNRKDDSVYKGIIGSYGKVKNAQAYAVFVGKKNVKSTLKDIGYYGEIFILDLLSQNIGTCWISGTFNKDNVLKNITLKDDEEIYAITPIGLIAYDINEITKILDTKLSNRKRKNINQISNLDDIQNKSKWMIDIVESVKVAPSAMNMQPWYITFNADTILLSTNSKFNINKKIDIDIGIAASHIEISLMNYDLKFEKSINDSESNICYKIL